MPDRIGKIDLHIHTTVSDGTDTPESIPHKVQEAGIRIFSVTDHDAIKAGSQILCDKLTQDGLCRFIPGAEFSCKDAFGKYHILAYGYDPKAVSLLDLVSRAHQLRMGKVFARLELLKKEFGFVFPEDKVDLLLTLDNPGKPHIGNLMVQYGFAKTKDEAINDYLSKIRVESDSMLPQEIINGILDGGGIPVLAHPIFGNGSNLITGDEMDKRLRRLMEFGLKGVEAFYSGFSAQQCAEMLSLAKKYDLYITAGSDYHGLNKTVALGETGRDDGEAYPEGLLRFLDAVGAI